MVKDGGDGKRRGSGAYNKPTAGIAPHEGGVHVVAGSAGQVSAGALDHPAMYYGINESGSVLLDVNGLVADLLFIDRFGNQLDNFRMIKGRGPRAARRRLHRRCSQRARAARRHLYRSVVQHPGRMELDFENDGSFDGLGAVIEHTYDEPGLYSVRQEVGNAVAFDDETKETLICVAGEVPTTIDTLNYGDGNFFGWFWTTSPGPYDADILRGDLFELVAAQGDFSGLTVECPYPDVSGTNQLDPNDPAVGEGYFYLVRTKDCAGGIGSFDTSSPTQIAPRGFDGGVSACD